MAGGRDRSLRSVGRSMDCKLGTVTYEGLGEIHDMMRTYHGEGPLAVMINFQDVQKR